MRETYLAVAGRIRREVEEVESVVERAQSIREEVDPGTDPGGYRALNLHGFYAGLDASLRRLPVGWIRRCRRGRTGTRRCWTR